MQSLPLRGRFVWHDLMTTDPTAALKFYPKIFGWKTQSWDQNPSYTLWVAGRGPIGGVMPLPAEAKAMGAPPHWMPFVGIPEVDATVRDAASLGARVLKEPTDIPTVGRFAILADPQGAVFAVFSSAMPMQGDPTPKLGEFSWHELATTDYSAAFDFYRALFGWEKTEAMDMGPAGVYQMFGWPNFSLGGIYNKPPEMQAPPHWLSYGLAPDAKKAADAVKRNGGQVLNGPMEVPGNNLIAQCLDPNGAAFAVHSKVEAVKATGARKAPAKAKAAPRRATRRKKAGR